MSALPLGQGVYDRLSNVPLVLKNMVWEIDPTNTEDQVSLHSRPGLTSYVSQGSSAIRGVYHQDGGVTGLIYFVTSTSLYSAPLAGGSATSLGTISGTSRVTFAANGIYLLVSNEAVLYSWNGSALSTVSFPDSAFVSSLAILNGYFLAARSSTQRIYFSAYGLNTFDALDYFSAETEPDDVLAIAVTGDELWVFGSSSVEVFVPATDPDLPFQRVNGRMFQMGCVGRDTVAVLDDGVCWVGQDRIVYHTASVPVPISTETEEQWLASIGSVDMYGWGYTVEGHITYVLTIGSDLPNIRTFAFSMGKWTQYTGFGVDCLQVWGSTRLTSGRTIVGSRTTGVIYVLDPTSTYDGTSAMICEFTGIIEIYGSPLRCDSVILDCTVGIGIGGSPTPNLDIPTIQMAISNDRGKTWQPWRTTYLGAQGAFSQLVQWCGAIATGGMMRRPGRLFKFRTAPPSRFTVRKARLNESPR